ncbi:sensor histidine kinase [Microcella humidisoli]|uniref:Sensor-like histidine kinase SenX3 n=1 Tax=Microcella humidisoli TaxID=2963406 RepID=A0ABY5FYX6_9MICO|nr:HAMP domain-containing sensor histidine kinase [Microcella humidisoli]UTT63258.1 HAMP domain-containing histidine kinase [Microcella humidisoli]
MTALDYLQIVGTAAAAAAVTGIAAAVTLRLARRAPIIVHVVVIVAAAVLAVAGGIALTANAMYISESDTAVALTVTAASGIVAIGVSVVLASALSRDARALGRDARRLGAGEAVEPADRCTAELDDVQGDLVTSSERLLAARDDALRSEQSRRELVTRIAHDLLAPVASIQAIAELLEDGLSAEPERHAHQLGAHAARLQSLVGDLFELSRIDAGALALTTETVSLTDLASDVVAEYGELARAHDVVLRFSAASGTVAPLDARQFSRALVNVLINAIEHSPAGGTVTVAVMADAHAAIVAVRDEGPGFEPGDVPHVFEAGWRGTSARTAPRVGLAGGAGLGLAITRAIIEAHGGTATAHASTEASGAEVRLRVPLG